MKARLLIAVSVAFLGVSPVAQVAVAQQQRVAAEDALDEGRRQLRRGEYFRALEAFRKANTLMGGRCTECLIAMAESMFGMKAWANVLETAQAAIDATAGDPRMQAQAYGLRARVFEVQAATNAVLLVDAEKAYRTALALDSGNEDLHYGLGKVLLARGDDAAAVAELEKFLEIRDLGPTADEVRALIANPRRGRDAFVPEFALVTVNGVRMSPQSLKGKVVLYDFWASWCPPCIEALPAIRRLQERYAANPDLVILSISADEDEGDWRRFTVKNNMTWPQFFDKRHEISMRFAVRGYPTYVLADREGAVKLRVLGDPFNRSKALIDAIDRELATPR
jgi:thioredoxin-like negative regulator of GroEL